MKRNLILVSLLLILALAFTSCTKVPQGYVGLRINTLGSDAGAIQVVGAGWQGNKPGIEYALYPTFVQQYPFTKAATEGSPSDEAIYFQSKDGVPCDVDVAVSAYAMADKADVLYKKYKKDTIVDIIHVNVRQSLRNAFIEGGSTMSVDELYSAKKIDLLKQVTKRVIAEYEPLGLVIQEISYLSDIRFPEVVTTAISAKYAAVQAALQRENEVAKAKAEADIKVANARGEADSLTLQAQAQAKANALLQQSLTPQLVQLKWIERWNGQLPTVTGGEQIVDMRSFMPK